MDVSRITPAPQQETETLTLNLEGGSSPKPAKNWPVIVILIIAVLAFVAIIAVILFRAFGDTSDTKKVITIVDVERQSGSNSGLFGMAYSEPAGKSADISVEINNLALNIIKNQFPDLAFLEKLDGMSVNTVFESGNGMARLALDLKADEQTQLPLEIVMDYNSQCFYVASELFGDNYLKFELSSLQEADNDMELVWLLLEVMMNSELTDRYFNSFLELMTAQETKTEVLTVNGVSQKCNVYTAKIAQKDICELVVDILKDVKERNSAYEKQVDSVIEQIEEAMDDDAQTLIWSVYTDSEGEIIGRDISLDDEKLFYYMITQDGEDLGLIISAVSFAVQGNATLKDGLMDGTFIVSLEDVDYLKLTADDFDVEGMGKGALNGSLEFEPTDELIELLFGAELSLPISIVMEFETTEDGQNVELSLMEIITLSINMRDFEPREITIPEGNEINGLDTDALSRLLGLMDLDIAV